MKKCIGLLLGVLLLLVGCGGEPMAAVQTSETAQVTPAAEEAVVAEAVIEPARWSALGFDAAGEVIEVLVEEGDTVVAGDLLIRLDSTDAQLAVGRAEAALKTAQAQLALQQAGARPEEIAAAEAQLKAAQATLEQAAAQRDQLVGGATKAEIAAAEAQVASAILQQKIAQDTYDLTDKNETQRKEQANYNLHAANESLAAAQAQLDQVLAGADRDQVRAAQASVLVATAQKETMQAQLDQLKAGTTAEQIAVAKAAVAEAEAAMRSAQANLAHTEIRAPFAGTVTVVNVEVGNTAVPGQVACVVATLDQLWARTTDLTELDVGQVTVGQPTIVTVDALPGRSFTGVVRQIALQAQDFRGQVVYDVTVELMGIGSAPLRWGMTAWVDFG